MGEVVGNRYTFALALGCAAILSNPAHAATAIVQYEGGFPGIDGGNDYTRGFTFTTKSDLLVESLGFVDYSAGEVDYLGEPLSLDTEHAIGTMRRRQKVAVTFA